MIRAESNERFLLLGLVFSLAAHFCAWGVLSGFVRIGLGNPTFELRNLTPPSPPEPPRIRLGIDDGRIESLAWIGFREETPNQGLPSTSDQSAMTPAPGNPAPAAMPTPAPPAALPPTQPAMPLTSAQIQEAAELLRGMGARLAAAAAELTRPTPPAPAAPASTSVASPAGGGGKSGDPGLLADKESIATSIKNAPTVKLGQVAAANGLDIQTRSPKWSVTTLAMRRPANPTIRITFGRDGRVVRAGFVTDGKLTHGTGSAEVDEPLLSAVYSWTAKGDRLAELTSQDPRGEVTIIITIILTG